MSRIRQAFLRFRDDPRSPVRVLAVAMAGSAAAILLLGHGATFSGDELFLVASSPQFDLHTAFEPHGGHLLALPRLVYLLLLETTGFAYLPFRILTVAAIQLTVVLLYAWARRRADPWLAVAPCVVLLFFAADHMHTFQGNGFIVVLSIAFGIAALLAVERDDRLGDGLACGLLILGVLTYSIVLAFLAGVAVLLLASKGWRRSWVFLLPLVLYGAWRLWLVVADVSSDGGGIDATAILLVPAWSFQSLAGVLGAMSGLGYDFVGSGPDLATAESALGPAGPALAVLALVLLALSIRDRGLGRRLAVALVVVLTLWTMQALSTNTHADLSIPGVSSRYLYPGALLVAMAALATTRKRPRGSTLALVTVLTLAAVSGNLIALRDGADLIRESGRQVKGLVGAIRLASPPGPAPESGVEPAGTDLGTAAVAVVNSPYGDLGFDRNQLLAQPEDDREKYDRVISMFAPFEVAPAVGGTGGCREVTGELTLPPGGADLLAPEGAGLVARRLADVAAVPVAALAPGIRTRVTVPAGDGPPWKISADAPLGICGRTG